jgi:predicted HNH restriction endonuclease
MASLSKKKPLAQIRSEKRDILLERRGGQCTNCGLKHDGTNGYIFDFHHINHNDKLFSIKHSNMDRKVTNLYIEADKCVLLCANCHRILHHHKSAPQKR